jgi:hypothetical protein
VIDLRKATSDAIDVLKRVGSKILEILKRIPLPRKAGKPSTASPETARASLGNAPRSKLPRVEIMPILRSKPFLIGSSVLGGFILLLASVAAIVARPLPKGKERLPALTDLTSLDDFKLPEYPERYETIEYSRDPDAPANARELASYFYIPGPEARAEAARLARAAVEEFYEGIE